MIAGVTVLSFAVILSGCQAIENTAFRYMSFDSFESGEVRNAREYKKAGNPVESPEGPYLSFFALGCAGSGNEGQRIVADSMAVTAKRYRTDFVLYLGDNFYGRGVRSTEDSQWKGKFEDIYKQDSLQIPFNAVLGNHDYYENPEAQVEYTKQSGRWHMPARYYSFEHQIPEGKSVEFFALDTTALLYGRADDQLAWFMEKLESSRAHWKIVYGHHPVYSGAYNRDKELRKMENILVPLLHKYRVDLYVSAHNHNVELFRNVEDVYYIVSGAGSRPRNVAWVDNASFAGAELGFVWLRAFDSKIEVHVMGSEGKIIFADEILKEVKAGTL